SQRALVLVDEAYADFADHTLLPLIASHPNLVIARTFSKARAAAGLRLVAPDHAGLTERVVCVKADRARVADALRTLPDIETFPSRANFLLFRHRTMRARAVHASL